MGNGEWGGEKIDWRQIVLVNGWSKLQPWLNPDRRCRSLLLQQLKN